MFWLGFAVGVVVTACIAGIAFVVWLTRLIP